MPTADNTANSATHCVEPPLAKQVRVTVACRQNFAEQHEVAARGSSAPRAMGLMQTRRHSAMHPRQRLRIQRLQQCPPALIAGVDLTESSSDMRSRMLGLSRDGWSF
jgi:hypothetical protein